MFPIGRKKTILAGSAAAIIMVFAALAVSPLPEIGAESVSVTGNAILERPASSDSAERIYKLFLCPCCGRTIDAQCCGMATKMTNYIDSLIDGKRTEEQVIVDAVKKYGVTSIVESERSWAEGLLAEQNPELFPESRISFSDAVGGKAPDFTLEGFGGKVKLSDYLGKNVILFFNEGSMCYPACWNQVAALANDERFNNGETATLSIVVDQKAEWEKIQAQLPEFGDAVMLFDTTRTVSTAYDVLSLPSSMHPGSFPGHTYFVIDKGGIIRYTLDDPTMAIRNEEMASEIEKLA